MNSLSLAISQLGEFNNQVILPEIPESLKYRNTDFKSQFLIDKRKELGLTILEVAQLAGFKHASKTARKLEQYEIDLKIPNDYINQLLEAYNVDLTDFETQTSPDYPQNKVILNDNKQLDDLNQQHRRILAEELTRIHREIINNLPLFWDHFDEIINTPNLYFTSLRNSYFSCAFITFRDNKVYLGDLLTLWKNSEWLDTCPECGQTRYAFAAGGSPLSGSGGGQGLCAGCGDTYIKIIGKGFSRSFLDPFRKLCTKQKWEDLKPFKIETILEVIKTTA